MTSLESEDPFGYLAPRVLRLSPSRAMEVIDEFWSLVPTAPGGFLVERGPFEGPFPPGPIVEPVRELLPPGYQRYVRLLHPVKGGDENNKLKLIRWRSLLGPKGLASLGDTPSEEALHRLGRPAQEAYQGQLDSGTATLLAQTIAAAIGEDAPVHFIFWGGRGGLNLPHRDGRPLDAVYEAPLSAVSTFYFPKDSPSWKREADYSWKREADYYSPTIWWSQDRSWCLSTYGYSASSYFGGPPSIADYLLESGLDTLPANLDDALDFVTGADT